MLLSLIVAMDRARLIGRDNHLPWRIPGDMRHFRAVTMGKPVVMGRVTHESIGRPLPGRDNLVISRDPGYQAPGCRVFPGLDEALRHCADEAEVVVIGGAGIYRLALAQVGRMYLTLVDGCFEGDCWFPEFDRSGWVEISRETVSGTPKAPYEHAFVVLERAPAEGDGRE